MLGLTVECAATSHPWRAALRIRLRRNPGIGVPIVAVAALALGLGVWLAQTSINSESKTHGSSPAPYRLSMD
jgi:hypothetical protein